MPITQTPQQNNPSGLPIQETDTTVANSTPKLPKTDSLSNLSNLSNISNPPQIVNSSSASDPKKVTLSDNINSLQKIQPPITPAPTSTISSSSSSSPKQPQPNNNGNQPQTGQNTFQQVNPNTVNISPRIGNNPVPLSTIVGPVNNIQTKEGQAPVVDDVGRSNFIQSLYTSGNFLVTPDTLKNPSDVRNTLSGLGVNTSDLSDNEVVSKVQQVVNNPYFKANNQISQQVTTASKEYTDLKNQLSTLYSNADASFEAQLDATTKLFDAQILLLGDVYDSATASRTAALTALGGMKYTPTIAPGFISNDIKNKMVAVTQLEAQKAIAIAGVLKTGVETKLGVARAQEDLYTSYNTQQAQKMNEIIELAGKINESAQTDFNKQIADDYASAIVGQAFLQGVDLSNPETVSNFINQYKEQYPSLESVDEAILLSSITEAYPKLGKQFYDIGITSPEQRQLFSNALQKGEITFDQINKWGQGFASLVVKSGIGAPEQQSNVDLYTQIRQKTASKETLIQGQSEALDTFFEAFLQDTIALEKKGVNIQDIPVLLPDGTPTILSKIGINWAGSVADSNDPTIANYVSNLNNVRNTYTGMRAIISGAQNPTETDKQKASEVIPQGLTSEALKEFKSKTIDKEIEGLNRAIAQEYSIAESFKNQRPDVVNELKNKTKAISAGSDDFFGNPTEK